MQITETRKERAWAVPKRPGFKGDAAGLYFHYYATRAEAEKAYAWLKRKGKYTGPVEHRPGECFELGWISF